MISEKIAFFVLCGFALFGGLILSVVLHEYSHAYDFRDVSHNESMCALVLPNFSKGVDIPLGYYEFDYKGADKNEIDRIDKFTEPKAYAISFSILFLLTVCITYVSVNRKRI